LNMVDPLLSPAIRILQEVSSGLSYVLLNKMMDAPMPISFNIFNIFLPQMGSSIPDEMDDLVMQRET
jgi:hypothetical protein